MPTTSRPRASISPASAKKVTDTPAVSSSRVRIAGMTTAATPDPAVQMPMAVPLLPANQASMAMVAATMPPRE